MKAGQQTAQSSVSVCLDGDKMRQKSKKSFNKMFDQETIYLQRIKGTIINRFILSWKQMMVVAKFSLTVSRSKTIENTVPVCKTENELIIPTPKGSKRRRSSKVQ